MNILVYEHVAGGGFSGGDIPPSILSEGYAMLRALTSDFKAAKHDVTVFLDSRIKAFTPPIEADEVISISSSEGLKEALDEASRIVDGVYIIAPESDCTLQNLVETVEHSGGTSLNCRGDAIEGASNKMMVYRTLKGKGIPTPETVMVDVHEDIKQIKRSVSDLGFPLVFKPLDGVGCCGLSVVKKEPQIMVAVRKITKESSNEYFIAQRLIEGTAASVSLISTDNKALPITLNEQRVTLSPPDADSSYNGGTVPFHHPSEKEALKIAQTTVESLTDIRGYIGVDMVLTNEGPTVIEVNPRLTTSYIGLRRVVSFNPAQAIVDAVLEHKLPKDVCASDCAYFLKVPFPQPTPEALLKTYEVDEVLSPPFPVSRNRVTYALLLSHSTNSRSAKTQLSKAEKRLLNILSTGD